MKICVDCFKSLGINTRNDIYSLLKQNPKGLNATEIVSVLDKSQSTVSYHLSQMTTDGLISSQKDGKYIIYTLSNVCPKCSKKCILQKLSIERS
jgi:ArsR family transcriptional regulator